MTEVKTQTDTNSQRELIYSYLEQGNTITPLEALNKFGCFRLGARIYELRRAGHNIITENITENGKTFAKYRLIRCQDS